MPARRGRSVEIFRGSARERFRWKFLTCPQGRVLTRIFWVSAREVFVEVVVEVDVEVVVGVGVNTHVDDVDE